MSYVRTLTICLLLVYFVSAARCHCFDFYYIDFFKIQKRSMMTILSDEKHKNHNVNQSRIKAFDHKFNESNF